MLIKHLKKGIAGIVLGLSIIIFSIPAARAQGDEILRIIAAEVLAILTLLDKYIPSMAQSAAIWLDIIDGTDNDDKSATTFMSESTTLNTAIQTNLTYQKDASLQKSLLNSFFGSTVPANVNDLTYQTLLGIPYVPPASPDAANASAFNYIKNASGLSITHPVPAANWRGKETNKAKYLAYFNTISAVQTFNSYVLSGLYAEYVNKDASLSDLQKVLMEQASSQDWFSQVGGESMGKVLREILMYDSQIYVQLVQLLQTEKQLLTAMTMSNTLFIVGNQFTENDLVGKASGSTPGST